MFWFLVTTFTDPGILPRGETPMTPPPASRDRKLDNGQILREYWCYTCNIYRPEGASHCRDCDNCVLDFDHHCPFTRNCIGARNYSSFILFLTSTNVGLVLILVGLLILAPTAHIRAVQIRVAGLDVGGALNALLIVYSFLLMILLGIFNGYHLSLVATGLTTREHLKGKDIRKRGLFDRFRCAACDESQIKPRQLIEVTRHNRIPVISVTQL